MKKIFRIIIIYCLLLTYVYTLNVNSIPNNIIILEGEKLNLKTVWGISINNYETALASSQIGNKSKLEKHSGTEQLSLDLFGKFSLKTVHVNIIPKTLVVPVGRTIGMKLYTNGVLVVGTSTIQGKDNVIKRPYENSGIEEGDRIIEINGKNIKNTNELINAINESHGNEITVKYFKDSEIMETKISPTEADDEYKIGLWVRDAAAGVGTLTFYEPATNMFMSLGHGIEDIDTGKIVEISNGELVTANVISIVKGKKDIPGEIRGTIAEGKTIGKIYRNTNLGVYGNLTNKENLETGEARSYRSSIKRRIKRRKSKNFMSN